LYLRLGPEELEELLIVSWISFNVGICLYEFCERFPPLDSFRVFHDIPYNNASPTFDFLDILLAELVQVREVDLRNVLKSPPT